MSAFEVGPAGPPGPAGAGGALLDAGSSIGATTVDVVDLPVDFYEGQLVGIGAGTSNCEIRRITDVTATTLTLDAQLKIAHSSAENVWVAPGFWIAPEWWGAVADDAAVDSYRPLINMLMDHRGEWGILGRGTYYSSRHLIIQDYCRVELSLRAFAPYAIDCTIGDWAGIPNQYFCMLNSEATATATFNATTNTVTFSISPGTDANKRVAFYPRPGATMPGGIEEGRHYFTSAGGVGPVSLALSQSGSAVDITSAGSGAIVAVWTGLSRLIGRLDLHGGKTKALNGLVALMQQPAEATVRIDQFPVVGATVGGDQMSLPNMVITLCWMGFECAGGLMLYAPRGNIEQCDYNLVIAESERIFLQGGSNNASFFGKGFHFEAAGDGVGQIQTLIPSATLTSGTFQLRFKNVLTAAINFNDTAAQIQTKLEAHAAIGAGNVTCTQLTGTTMANGMIQCDFTVGDLQWELWVGSTSVDTGGEMAVANSTLAGGTVSVNFVNPNGRNISFREGFGFEFDNCQYSSSGTRADGTKAPFIKTDGTAISGTGYFQSFVLKHIVPGSNSLVMVDDTLTGELVIAGINDATGVAENLVEYIRAGRRSGSTGRHWFFVGDGGRRIAMSAAGAPTLELKAESGQSNALLGLIGTGAFVEIDERSADPSAPAANKARWFCRDNGSGKTQLCVRFPTGAIQVIATEP